MLVTREMCVGRAFTAPDWEGRIVQAGLGGDPWKVAVASILLNRTGGARVRPVVRELLRRWPTPGDLARADADEVATAVRPCGLHRNKARALIRFSTGYAGDHWKELRELHGVGPYVNDAVGLVCFGLTDLESSDGALELYRNEL